jgi:fucose 4-O-acetylase-like acetyltransferase
MKRIAYLDNAKYVAIVLMILGHCYWKFHVPYLNDAIYSFHMPLFFIVSGFFIKPLSFKDAVSKYFKAYLIPYFVTGMVTLLLLLCVDSFLENRIVSWHISDWFIRWTFASGSFEGKELFASTPIVGPVWFLFALFWSCLIYSILKSKYDGFNLMVYVIMSFLMSLISIHYVRFPFSIQAGMSAVLFLWLGDVTRKYSITEKLGENSLTLICMIIIWGICILRGNVVVSNCVYGLGLISIFGAYAGSLIFLIFVLLLSNHAILSWGNFGTKTLYVLCIHEVFQYSHFIYGNPFALLQFHPILNLAIEFVVELTVALVLTAVLCNLKQVLIKQRYGMY